MAFGPSFRGAAESMHAEKEDIQDYEFQKSGACRVEGWQDKKTTLPSMIAAVRGPLACGEVFRDGALLTSVWLAWDDKFSLEKDCLHLSARS
jgi:hypothetical protein